MNDEPWRLALKVCFAYVAAVVVWIVISNRILSSLLLPTGEIDRVQAVKILILILGSAGLIYITLGAVFRKKQIASARQARVQQLVRENRDRLQGILDSMFTFVGLLTLQGVVEEINRAPIDAAGLKREDILGKSLPEIYWWSHSQKVQEQLRECITRAARGEPVRRDFEMRMGDGQLIAVDLVVTPLRNARHEVVQLVTSAVDVTDRNNAEIALRDSEERFRQLAENINEVFWLADPKQNKVLYVSPAYQKIWGRSPDTLSGNPKAWLEGVHPEDRNRISLAVATKQSAGTYDEQYRILRPDGSVRWIRDRAFPVANQSGQIYRLVGVAEDITEQMQARAALEKSEAQFRAIFDGTALGVSLVDREGRLVKCNPSLCRMLGYSEAELSQMTFAEFTHPEDVDTAWQLYSSLLSGERDHYAIMKRYTRKDGQIVWGHLTVSLLKHDGMPSFAIGMVEDITESRKLEDQVRQMQKMEAIGRLAGGVAHDFNNILAVIQIQAGLLSQEPQITPKHRTYANEIIRASERAADLTRQLLVFSRRQAIQAGNHDLNEVVSNMAKMLLRLIGEDIDIQFKWEAEPLFIQADSGMIDQILMNLVVNARDAMPNGGKLRIETEAATFDELSCKHVPNARPGSFAVLTVADTGKGIAQRHLPHIFEPFFTTKDIGKGTGLGLATVFSIVQQHHGWIHVVSNIGKGTRFQLYFPRLREISATEAKPPLDELSRSGNETILLVEDDPAVNKSLHDLLQQLGYSVFRASSGVKALEVWKKHQNKIQLLLTDLILPNGLSGMELARKLLHEKADLKTIYMSGYNTELTDEEFHLQEGVNFLQKPYSAPRLAEALRRNLDPHGKRTGPSPQ